MVLTYYIVKFPYKMVWNFLNLIKKRTDIVFYCANELDLEIFKNVQRHLNPIPVVAKNRSLQKKLLKKGINAKLMPVFPKGVIMCRQACYLFPESKIVRIGISHGAYHFKPFANVKGHNMFNQFHFTSSKEVEEARLIGITSGVGLGFPKMDDAFNGTYSEEVLGKLKEELNIDPNKKTVLFSATWDGSQMSAVHEWYNKLSNFTSEYNVLVTLHVWTSKKYKSVIKNTPGVNYIESQDITPYIMISDICVGDTSSILSEMSALYKPIVSFKVPFVKRTVLEVREIIKSISFQIEKVSELDEMLEYACQNINQKEIGQEVANKRMFETLDGRAGERVANKIIELLPELRIEEEKTILKRKMRYNVNPKYNFLTELIERLPDIFEKGGTCIYEGRNTIKTFNYDGLIVNVKSFKIPHFINKVAYAFLRGSKAKHSYDYGTEIIRRGASTPEPIAYLELLKNGLFNKSYYVSIHYPYDFMIRDLIGFEFPDKDNILRQFVTYTYEKLHKNGIFHLDYSRGNILIRRIQDGKYDFSIVDINRLKFLKLNYLKGLSNFSQIWADDEELEIIAREYARINNRNEDEAVQLLIKFDTAHKTKINRKNALKTVFKRSVKGDKC
ncbi:CDP-glycerol glycerophosphotransferase family protein [Labilibaculum sp. K2S]|uniref:CDP-glycerol glycerophosphotransferase family protein n=1 Tax=Labilibaculum sp. K2S TaxID=3056386 RepID=UPI0025A3E4CC|nr:CDP-glycerol glycerophosphotransferase family protein [Labilibaculum sp. K2S]MDM8161994.1 CDP-glycerol glycerophosphotransferase family protein [Labilibaculum sp. K2S]